MCEPHNPDNVFNQRTVFVELEGPMAIVFGEATPEQQIQCCKLVSAAFGSPLSEEDFLEREKHLGQQPLTRNHGWRCWCLSPPNKPNHVLATCKTIRRNLLVRDASGSREQQGYCISSVVTDSRYRQLGLASFLLKRVAEWMDGPGDGIASMLYCSIGNFYATRGWNMLTAFQLTLSPTPSYVPTRNRGNLPSTRPLTSDDIQKLCASDVEDITTGFKKYTASQNEVHMVVLPTADIITWLQRRGDFISLKVHGKAPKNHGAICQTANSWVYWHHDFGKQQLGIQRARIHGEGKLVPAEAAAGLLLDAVEEAYEWNLPKVALWDPNDSLLHAAEILAADFDIDIVNEERVRRSIPSVRWRDSDETKKVTVHLNEIYAWS